MRLSISIFKVIHGQATVTHEISQICLWNTKLNVQQRETGRCQSRSANAKGWRLKEGGWAQGVSLEKEKGTEDVVVIMLFK